jgi:hypothetical protein
MTYWLDSFTGTTWEEFKKAGSKVTGFNERLRQFAGKVQPGDVFLCYLIGVMRWVGALEVIGPSNNRSRIWSDAEFPVRFEVKPLVMLEAEHGVPMDALKGRVHFYTGDQDRGKFQGFVRRSPNPFRRIEDAELIIDLLKDAEAHPIARPVDPKKYAQKPFFKAERQKGKVKESLLVSVPDSDEESPEDDEAVDVEEKPTPSTRHTEIQFALLSMGSAMGLELWVARNDRSRTWNGETLGKVAGMIAELPTQFNEATNRTIELIDVLWLRGNSILAAFEVECTTSVYSGLLRMSDLLALQPNIDIKLYLVAPEERRNKVEQEIQRPTFKLREKSLPSTCGFLPFKALMEKIDGIMNLGLAKSVKPDFLESVAEYFIAEEAAE